MRRFPICLFCAAILAGGAFSQSTEPKPAFETADIHVSPDYQNFGAFRGAPWVGDGRYAIRSTSLLDLIAAAYGVDPEKVLGGPNWLEWDHFDVNAKVLPDSTAETQKIMLQTLLADRFKLAVRDDTRDLLTYALTAGKSPKLKQADKSSGESGCRSQLTGPGITQLPGGGVQITSLGGLAVNAFTCHDMTMEAFAQFLIRQVNPYPSTNPVMDQTELKGAWDFDFKTTFQLGPAMAAPVADRITIFDAVDKQLGLKLTATKTPLRVVIVDSAQKPTPNAPGAEESFTVSHAKEFDVADVKPSDPGGRGGRIQITRGGGVNFQNLPLQVLILRAYGIDSDMLVSAPAMQEALQTRYVIIAKPPASTRAALAAQPAGQAMPLSSPDDNDAAWFMMRALLEDRFKLAVHQEERQLTCWKLVAVKPKMKKADPSERTKTAEGPGADGKDPRTAMPSRGRLVMYQNVTMAQFADNLEGISAYLHTPVRDATGLEGSYDFTVSFSPVNMTQGGGGRGGDSGPAGNGVAEAADPNGAITLFEAIEQQMGLKLVEEKRAVKVFVIDRVESKPTDN